MTLSSAPPSPLVDQPALTNHLPTQTRDETQVPKFQPIAPPQLPASGVTPTESNLVPLFSPSWLTEVCQHPVVLQVATLLPQSKKE